MNVTMRLMLVQRIDVDDLNDSKVEDWAEKEIDSSVDYNFSLNK